MDLLGVSEDRVGAGLEQLGSLRSPKLAFPSAQAHLVKLGCLWTWNAKRLEHLGKRTTPIAFLAAVWARAEAFQDSRREFRAEGR